MLYRFSLVCNKKMPKSLKYWGGFHTPNIFVLIFWKPPLNWSFLGCDPVCTAGSTAKRGTSSQWRQTSWLKSSRLAIMAMVVLMMMMMLRRKMVTLVLEGKYEGRWAILRRIPATWATGVRYNPTKNRGWWKNLKAGKKLQSFFFLLRLQRCPPIGEGTGGLWFHNCDYHHTKQPSIPFQ